jgi:hypothetical protein
MGRSAVALFLPSFLSLLLYSLLLLFSSLFCHAVMPCHDDPFPFMLVESVILKVLR